MECTSRKPNWIMKDRYWSNRRTASLEVLNSSALQR